MCSQTVQKVFTREHFSSLFTQISPVLKSTKTYLNERKCKFLKFINRNEHFYCEHFTTYLQFKKNAKFVGK